ncbi:MAG: NAD-glutamate dehydrogenase domain-containing protein [Phycisphaerales bacterium]
MSSAPAGDLTATPSPEGVLGDLVASMTSHAEEVVPWFLENMPLAYFQDTDPDTRLEHLRAILSSQASGRPIELTLRSADGTEWTSMRPGDGAGVLAELVSELPHDMPLRAAKIHTARDGSLVIDTFIFGEPQPRFDPAQPDQAEMLERALSWAAENTIDATPDEIRAHFARCEAEYLHTVTPLRFAQHMELWKRVSGTDGTEVELERESDPQFSRIVVAVANATTRRMLERLARRISFDGIQVHRAYLDVIDDGKNGSMSILGFVCQGPDGGPLEAGSDLWKRLRHDLLRNKWVEHRTLQLAYRNRELGIQRAEVITGLSDLAHQLLIKRNTFGFNSTRIGRLVERSIDAATGIADLFLARFAPGHALDDDAFRARRDELHAAITRDVDLEDARTILTTMLEAVTAVLRTNVHLESRFSLAMRIDPAFLATEDRSELPFGVFFVHGRGFNGFHVRFRDIARGGLRAVRTRSEEQHALESERLYDEAYNLAFAQQLKNKDIPEGGAKAAILLDPYARVDRAVKAFVDGLLDLITPEPAIRERIVDFFGSEELLYLGPDENITPEFIVWIVNRARRRGYLQPNAFMSSKPGAGINHKEYGVTSEGVNVFLDVALQALDIDPRTQPFTVKMTGGPDGDVGGNLLNILKRDYGDNPKVVGVADGSGSGEDPDGLDMDELLRLFHAGDPIAEFDRAKLGPRGAITGVDEPNGVMLRNTLHNRIEADAFVPCGGRPNAIHGGNWRDFLKADGSPSARVIIEGANLFLTAEARNHLSDAGAMIMKDSSANKCGVITSSYEIISNMLMEEDEFLAIKTRFVDEVKSKLRAFARAEAELLVRIHRHHPHVPLPTMSTRLSRVMIRTSDAVEEAADRLMAEHPELMRQLVLDHIPSVLVEKVGDRLFERLPDRYLRWMMAKSLAGRIVYREGFEYLEAMPLAAIAELAVRYLGLDIERDHLATEVEAGGSAVGKRVAEILRQAGIFSTMHGE